MLFLRGLPIAESWRKDMADPAAPCGCEESLRLARTVKVREDFLRLGQLKIRRLERRLYIKRLEAIALKLRGRRDIVLPWSYIPGIRANQHDRRERWALRTIAVNALLEMARNP